MGMSIDEAITWLNTDDFESKGFADATSVAIETMRKYQKIEQVLFDYINDDSVGMSDYWMGRIKEVIEDGNIH